MKASIVRRGSDRRRSRCRAAESDLGPSRLLGGLLNVKGNCGECLFDPNKKGQRQECTLRDRAKRRTLYDRLCEPLGQYAHGKMTAPPLRLSLSASIFLSVFLPLTFISQFRHPPPIDVLYSKYLYVRCCAVRGREGIGEDTLSESGGTAHVRRLSTSWIIIDLVPLILGPSRRAFLGCSSAGPRLQSALAAASLL